MEALAERISRMMVRAGACPSEDAEVVAYGLFVMMSGAVQISLLLTVSLILGITPAMAAFVLPYSLLKRTIGGWHAKTHVACLAGYTSLATALACAGWFAPQALTQPATLLLGAFMVATIWLRAPVGHPNNPQRPAQMRRFKRIGRAVATAEWLILTGLAVVGGSPGLNSLALCGALGGGAAAVTLLIPLSHSAEKGEKAHEKAPVSDAPDSADRFGPCAGLCLCAHRQALPNLALPARHARQAPESLEEKREGTHPCRCVPIIIALLCDLHKLVQMRNVDFLHMPL